MWRLTAFRILQIKLPGKNVESYTDISPVSLSGTNLKYGEFTAKEPFSVEEMRLHFENNSPFAVVTKLVREVEISNWGNVYYEEHYTIKHKGPKIRVKALTGHNTSPYLCCFRRMLLAAS